MSVIAQLRNIYNACRVKQVGYGDFSITPTATKYFATSDNNRLIEFLLLSRVAYYQAVAPPYWPVDQNMP